ncbi:MAG: hypothetical protein ACTSSP_04580 [Candidatus Asgardarchaeia archaeon]
MNNNWDKPSIAIVMTSRNNYDYMDAVWARKTLVDCDINNIKILNIDEDSTEEEKNKGRKICDKYKNMTYMDREEPGMHHNIDTAIRFFGEDIKYLVWFQHDCWPIQKDFFYRLNELVSQDKLSKFGLLTFNALAQNMFKHDNQFDEIFKEFEEGKKPLGVLTRSHLESVGPGDLYYCGYKVKSRILHPISKELFSKPFACSEANFFCQGINVKTYREHIDKNRPFYYFKSWDDISLQFLLHNVYNLVLPDFYVEHRPDSKRKFDLPYLSVKPVKKGKNKYHSASGHGPKEWIKIWGWDHQYPKTFEKVKKKYKGTLLYEFYKYDYAKKGPYKVFDI